MLSFESFVSRHGEFGVQAILDQIEHDEGVGSTVDASLEDRWRALMGKSRQAQRRLAG
jgi:hypothetical protein